MRSKVLTVMLSALLLLFGCRQDTLGSETTELNAEEVAVEPDDEDQPEIIDGARIEIAVDEAGNETRWLVYDRAAWDDDFNGLVTYIHRVAVTDEKITADYPDRRSVVTVGFTIENSTDDTFTTYPDQAMLQTSTGEQIELPDIWISDYFGGEIDGRSRREGNVSWYVADGSAQDIEWIILRWYVYEGAELEIWDAARMDYSIRLILKRT
jgi:hypothetical protein